MAIKKRTYGKLAFIDEEIVIVEAEPHICLKLKAIFPKIPKTSRPPFSFADSPDICNDILWFMDRYPLGISETDLNRLKRGKKKHIQITAELERIMLPEYNPIHLQLKYGLEPRDYQIRGKEILMIKKRLLIGDDTGLGKTLIGILASLEPVCRPALVVCQTHLPKQWMEQIEKFTDMKVHIIKKGSPYILPSADVYVMSYSKMAGWVNIFDKIIKLIVFDECQELRHDGTLKYSAARELSNSSEYVLGLSATPIYNYGAEIYNVLNLINPLCLGEYYEFATEWSCNDNKGTIRDVKALGTYLRENFLMLRRTRKDVGRELPPINRIVHTVEYNEAAVEDNDERMQLLAMKVFSGSFMERGQASRELDIMVRQDTGIGKAAGVANYVRMILEGGEPVILAGWHRRVYEIWNEMLADFNPVMFTGSETPSQKEAAKNAFLKGETNLFIISLRSGIGLDGLQHRCNIVVVGELDWSPKVHEQLISRADRDGQQHQVTAIFPVCDYGSDPLIIDMLGLKSSQSSGIMDPLLAIQQTYSDESRMKLLAERFLKKKGISTQ